jgi:hypothetical protein
MVLNLNVAPSSGKVVTGSTGYHLNTILGSTTETTNKKPEFCRSPKQNFIQYEQNFNILEST